MTLKETITQHISTCNSPTGFCTRCRSTLGVDEWNTIKIYVVVFVALAVFTRVLFPKVKENEDLIWAKAFGIFGQRTGAARNGRRSPDPEKKGQDRKFGEWTPVPFTRPKAPPYPDFSIHTTKPLPYRPFRYGPKYNVNMGLRPMPWDSWIELDNDYLKFHSEKARRIEERASKCVKTAPEAYPAAVELLGELCDYLGERYPETFRWIDDSAPHDNDVSSKEGRKFRNTLTGEVFTPHADPLPESPLLTSARLIQDDLAIMIEKSDGQYYLLGGAILLAGFWRLSDKFGMPLSEIHTSGDVPQFREKLERGMMNFFRRIKPEAPVLRNNYFLQVDDCLGWSSSIGDEDTVGDGEGTAKVGWDTAEKDRAIENHWFRSERQSLRRLPKSGAVVFTIRTYFHPITEISQEQYVPGRLASAVRSWGDDVSKYKGKEKYQGVLLEYLDRKHEEQVANGLDLTKEDEVRSYPW